MGGGTGVGKEVTETEQESDAGGRAKKIAQRVGPRMGAIRGQEQADNEDFRAEQDAKTKGGADRQGVKHESVWRQGRATSIPAGQPLICPVP